MNHPRVTIIRHPFKPTTSSEYSTALRQKCHLDAEKHFPAVPDQCPRCGKKEAGFLAFVTYRAIRPAAWTLKVSCIMHIPISSASTDVCEQCESCNGTHVPAQDDPPAFLMEAIRLQIEEDRFENEEFALERARLEQVKSDERLAASLAQTFAKADAQVEREVRSHQAKATKVAQNQQRTLEKPLVDLDRVRAQAHRTRTRLEAKRNGEAQVTCSCSCCTDRTQLTFAQSAGVDPTKRAVMLLFWESVGDVVPPP